jgi:Flp pilus assembly protein TadG
MMRRFLALLHHRHGSAAAELALVIPMMLALMFGSLELGNLFLDEHALSKQVRDGARFAARLEIDNDFDCPDTVFAADDATEQIINVTKEGVVSGDGNPRWTGYWDRTCAGGGQTIKVSIRCVAKDKIDTEDTGNTGIYSSLPGNEIPVVKVSGEVKYRSVLAAMGFDVANVCLKAESEAAVAGV